MSKAYNNWNKYKDNLILGRGRGNQLASKFEVQFDESTLHYLHESVLNHIGDSIKLGEIIKSDYNRHFNDFSFFTAPAYKAFEGYLFQVATDLKLPSSGNPNFVGTYFDEEKVDDTIDALIAELQEKAEGSSELSKDETQHIKDMVSEMKRFLIHYRHTPAHFHGESLATVERANQNVMGVYRIINETTKTLLNAGLIHIDNSDIH